MSEVIERLQKDFKDPTYRHIYDEGFLNSSIATQIKVLREEREWTQATLATEAKMNQSRISELEDVNFNSWTIRTLRKLAKAFDLRLKISFEEFGTLLYDFRNLNRTSLSRRPFSKDPAFVRPSQEKARAAAAGSEGAPKLDNISGATFGMEKANREQSPRVIEINPQRVDEGYDTGSPKAISPQRDYLETGIPTRKVS